MADERFKKLTETLDPWVEGFMDANPEWLAEELGPILTGEIPNWMVQEVLGQVVDLLIVNLIAKGKMKVEKDKLCWVKAA